MRKALSSWCWEDVERQAGVPADGMGPSPSESIEYWTLPDPLFT